MRKPAVPHPSYQANGFSDSTVFSEAIRGSLEVDILPGRKTFPRKFKESDIRSNRYHSGRVPCDPHLKEFPDIGEQYEQLMQHYFWKGLESPDYQQEPELYITGPVGCGKSTFVDFYLRHYCPEKGKYPNEFDKKLVVYFDARGIQYHKYANEAFFHRLLKAIEQHCEDHNISLPVKSRKGSTNRAQEALEMLSDFCTSSKNFRYLVLVLDNLDNCSASVQRQVVQYVNDIKKYTSIKLWRVIIPLWPTTYDTFTQTTEALTVGKPRICLGPPVEREFIQKRLDVVKRQIIDETRVSLNAGSKSTLEECAEFESFVDFVFGCLQTEQIGRLIRDICNDDLRRELWIWEGILRSAAAYDLYQMRLTAPSRHYEYEWMESLLAGDYRTRVDQKGRVANLFTMHNDSVSPRDVLAGYYACQLLSLQTTRKAWLGDMMRLGYHELHLYSLETSLRRYNLLHPIPEEFVGEEFEVHLKAVNAYMKIFSHPAYVDNMAMITPVDAEAGDKIRQTSGHFSRDLPVRVQSSTAFIEFICGQEKEFVEMFRALSGEDNRTRLKELQWLDGKKLRSASCAMAGSYIERLDGLVASRFLENRGWVADCRERLRVVRDSFKIYLI